MSDSRRDFDVSTPNKKNRKEDVIKELEKIRKIKGSPEARKFVQDLYKQYPEEFVDEFNRLNAKRLEKIRRKAETVASKVIQKYQHDSRPLHEILAKMVRYKNQNDWTDVEYEIFRSELEKRFQGKRSDETDYNQWKPEFRSRINRTLGYRSKEVVHDEGLNIKDNEHGTLSEILNMYEKSLALHRANIMESLTYDDCDIRAITGEFNSGKHIASNHIHPLLAAMFFPKIGLFESQMLYSNIGEIIKSRYENKPISTEANAMLFNDMTTDPNDVVCDSSSAIVDLKKRYQVAIDLWEVVQNLRNGKYYDGQANTRLMANLNMCRNNLYDNADLTYNQDEGAILRRLLSVFSLRPTLISTRPIASIESFISNPWMSNLQGLGGVQQTGFPVPQFINQPMVTVTKVPMLIVQLPAHVGGNQLSEPISLQQAAATQMIWINENKNLIPKEQSVIHSREVIIFYVNRRSTQAPVKTLVNPLMFSGSSPISFSNFEKINDHPVDFPESVILSSGGDSYELRSVVALTEIGLKGCTPGITAGNSLISGSIALIKTLPNAQVSSVIPSGVLCYDPHSAAVPIPLKGGAGFTQDKPVTSIQQYISAEGSGQSFVEIASKKGTVFIYSKPCGMSTFTTCETFLSMY